MALREPPPIELPRVADATLAFVREHATRSSYGGGCELRLRIGDTVLKSLDGWRGTEYAEHGLAVQLEAAIR